MTTVSIVLLGLTNLLLATGVNYLMKTWATTEKMWLLFFALSMQVLASACAAVLIKHGGLAATMSVISVCTLLITVSLGIFWFQEQLSSLQFAGIIVALTGVCMILFLR